MAKNYAKRDFKKRSSSKNKTNLGWLWLLTGILIGGFGFGLIFLKKNITVVTDTSAPLTQVALVKTVPPASKHNSPPPAKASTDDKTRYDFYTMLPNSQVQNQPVSEVAPEPITPPKPTKPLDQAEQTMFNQTTNAAVPVNSTAKTTTTPAAATVIVKPAIAPIKSAVSTNSSEPSDLSALESTSGPKSAFKKKPLDEGTRYSIDTGNFSSYELADARKAELTMAGYDRIHIESYIKGTDATSYRVLVGPYKSKADAVTQQKALNADHFTNDLLTLP